MSSTTSRNDSNVWMIHRTQLLSYLALNSIFCFFWKYLQVLRRLFVKSGEMQDSRSEVKNNFQTMQLVILRPRKQKEESSSLLQMVSETLLWFKFCDSRMYTSNPQIDNKLLPLSFASFPWSYYFFFFNLCMLSCSAVSTCLWFCQAPLSMESSRQEY